MSQLPGYEQKAERRFAVMWSAVSILNADTTRDDQFTNVLVGLAMELCRAFGELKSGVQQRVMSRAALAARNLLELRYWTSFAALSEDNIWRIRKDALIDARDMLDKFAAACEVNNELKQAVPIITQARTEFEKQCKLSGESCEGTYIRVADLARQLGLSDEHRSMSSFLSKLIHPTGFSICRPGTDDFAYQQLYCVGCWYFNDSFERLNGILKVLQLPLLENTI